jgi:UDP-2,3-diacylglucosamine hydrolase
LATLFVSDVHLSVERPSPVERFIHFLATEAPRADALYLLGDVFDLWLGDDDLRPPNAEVLQALATISRGGVPVYAMHGNHDFLLAEGFAHAAGCRLLPDPVVVHLYGERVLVSHGDVFCTDDHHYQEWRAFTRNRTAQAVFRNLPLALRRAYAALVRRTSRARTSLKPREIMDVNAGAVAAAMHEHGVRRLIHGHTHRPGVYPVALDGTSGERVVLGDWYEQDSALVWGPEAYRLCRLADLAEVL